MHIDLHDIVTEEFQEQMQNSFARLSGFGVVFTDSEGVHIGKGGNFTKFCQAINCREDGASCCALTNRQAIRMALNSEHPDRPAIFVCHAGLVNIELPILHEGKCLGAFTAGQVLCEEDCYPRDNSQGDVNWQSDPQLAEYYKEIPVLSRRHIENTADLMCDLAQYILKNHTYTLMQKKLAHQKEELLLYEKRQAELEHLLMQTKFDALQKQVMPHFIFNVLNSVSRLISMQDYDRAQQMLTAFTQMMRYSLSNTQQTIMLGQELDYVRNYLAIQQLRFGDRIQYDILCDPGMELLQLPFFAIQPLVENSIEHGILHMSEGGQVLLSCRRLLKEYRIELTDNGSGIDETTLENIRRDVLSSTVSNRQEHVGLHNCYNRLKILYGDAVRFDLSSNPDKGTCVRISINADYAICGCRQGDRLYDPLLENIIHSK